MNLEAEPYTRGLSTLWVLCRGPGSGQRGQHFQSICLKSIKKKHLYLIHLKKISIIKIKFTHQEIHLFKVYNAVAFLYLQSCAASITGHLEAPSSPPKGTLSSHPHPPSSPHRPPARPGPLATANLLPVTLHSLLSMFYRHGLTEYWPLC